MPELIGSDPNYLLEHDTPIRYAVNELGLSRDIAYLDFPLSLTILAASLAERQSAPSVQPQAGLLEARHRNLDAARLLPSHLESKQAFVKRAYELIGQDNDGFLRSEVVAAINANRHKQTAADYQQFEHDIAFFYSRWLNNTMAVSAEAEMLFHHGTVVTEQASEGVMLCTGDELHAQLPQEHCGIIQCAPTVTDALIRIGEVRNGNWEYTALLGSRAFNAALAQYYAAAIHAPSNAILAAGNGLATDIEALLSAAQELPILRRGFGAMVLSCVLHLEAQDIARAVHAAPQLLAPGGILLISDLERHPQTQGSVWQIIQQARTTFGHAPDIMGLMTEDDGQQQGQQQGQQAVFINKA